MRTSKDAANELMHKRMNKRLNVCGLKGRRDVSDDLFDRCRKDEGLFESNQRGSVWKVKQFLSFLWISTNAILLDPIKDLKRLHVWRQIVEFHGVHDEFEAETKADIRRYFGDWIEGYVEEFEVMKLTDRFRYVSDFVE